MSELPASDARAARRSGRRHGRPAASGGNADRSLNSQLLRLAVAPAAAVTAVGAAAAALLFAIHPSATTNVVVACVAAAGCVAVLVAASAQAGAVARGLRREKSAWSAVVEQETRHWVSRVRLTVRSCQEEVQQLAEQLHRGERPAPPAPEPAPAAGDHPFVHLEHDVRQAMLGTQAQFVQLASRRQVDVFVNLARRLQSLIGRAIKELDELEREVEDPDLLKGLFSVDHLATRVRRQAESLAVLGGAVSRRFSKPVRLYTVLRSSVAEVEHYARVKVVPPVDGNLRGHAVADVIHLIAELVENATMFSPPETHVLLRAQKVTAGLAIEVEDRGVGMPAETQQRMNELLMAPEQFDIGELLKDGRIGLYVVATLARRHGVVVRLHSNIYGGTQAVVVLPHSLIGDPGPETAPAKDARRTSPQQLSREPAAALTAGTREQQPAAVRSTAPAPARAPMPEAVPQAASRPVSAPEPFPASVPPGAPPPVVVPAPASRSAPFAVSAAASGPAPASPPPSGGASAGPGSVPSQSPATQASGGGDSRPTAARPPLPHRSGSYMAPQLRDVPEARREPVVGHSVDLMAAFQEGFNRAGEKDGQSGHDDHVG
jgi:signal transduction histidine kinase